MNLGIVLEKQDKFYEAAAGFNKVVELDPIDFKPHFYLGLLSQKIGNDEDALKSYAKTIGLCPNHPDSHINIGNILYKKKLWEEEIIKKKRQKNMK